jgi:hypothetical protein
MGRTQQLLAAVTVLLAGAEAKKAPSHTQGKFTLDMGSGEVRDRTAQAPPCTRAPGWLGVLNATASECASRTRGQRCTSSWVNWK